MSLHLQALYIALQLPFEAHRYLLPLLLNTPSLEVQLGHRFLTMCKTLYHSSNESVKFIMKHCMNVGNSIIGNNPFDVCSQFDCNITEVVNSKLSKQKY